MNTAIDNGADSVEAVSDATGASTGCGTCWERIENMVGARCPLKALQSA